MSASREKNKRKELAGAPVAQPQTPAKKGMGKGVKRALGIIIAAVVLAIIVFFTMLTSGFFAANTVAATVGSHEISPAELNYYYYEIYTSYTQQYGDMISYLFDVNQPLDEQYYDEESGTTWADYFTEEALLTAATNYAIYDEAIANGFELSEEELASVDSYASLFDSYAVMNGLANADAYLAAQFGAGCNQENFREYMLVEETARLYAQKTANDFTYTAEEVAAEFEANANEYTGVNYRTYFIPFDSVEETESSAENAAKAEVLKIAAEMAVKSEGDEQAFLTLCVENASEDEKASYEDDSYTLREDAHYSHCVAETADWLFDKARNPGDTTYIETETGVYVLYYISFYGHEEQLVNVRHILVSATDTEDAAAAAAAREQAEAVYETYLAGEQTEEAFAELAKQFSTDGTASNGGLMESIYPGQMVEAFNDWCFDESRQIGDTEIVDTEYGSHIMYFSGKTDTVYHDYLAETTLRNNDYTAWYEEATANVSYETNNFGLRMTSF